MDYIFTNNSIIPHILINSKLYSKIRSGGDIVVIVIPAYEPDDHLVQLVKRLIHRKDPIVIVNDGSSDSKAPIFNLLKPYVHIVSHTKNLGKGEAMKTGLKYIQKNMPSEDGVVFIDADGQHTIADMDKVIDAFRNNKKALILGSREFKGDIPLKSLVGNKITRVVFSLLSGKKISDTQTGLRAVSTRYIPFLLEIEGERYEYEMNMLLTFTRNKIKIVEVPIETVYKDKENSSSHFRVVRDSIRVYGVIFNFMASSAICAGLDYLLFLVFLRILTYLGYAKALIVSNILARVISAITNYNLNKKYVFKSKNDNAGYKIKYAALAIGILGANSMILYLFTNVISISAPIAKIFTEISLFIISFLVQQRFIFRKR